MEYLYLILAMGCSAGLSVSNILFKKRNAGVKNSSYLYSLFVSLSAFISWGVLLAIRGADFDTGVLIYSALFGIFYITAMIGAIGAFNCGSASLTGFMKQISLVLPAIWGFFFWENELTVSIGIGLVLIVISLCLCFSKRDGGENGKKNFSKWLVFAALLLVGNAGTSIVQKYQSMRYLGACDGYFMVFGVGFSALIAIALYAKNGGCKLSAVNKVSFVFPLCAGVSSAILNVATLFLMSSEMSESVFLPAIAVGGLVITVLYSTVLNREKPTLLQWLGLIIGSLAIVLLNV